MPPVTFCSGITTLPSIANQTWSFEPGSSDQVWLKIGNDVVLTLQDVTGGNIQYHEQCKKAPKAEKH